VTRTMYDSTNPYDIPRTAHAVAGYVDGRYAWPQAGWDWHGAPLKVRITVTGQTLNAHVADVENGDLTPAQGAAWLKRKKAAGQIGALYFSRGLLSTVVAAVRAEGLGPADWTIWEADWTAVPHLRDSAYAVQYDHPPHSGGHYDLSLVADYWPGVDPKPAPAPAPAPTPPPPPPAPEPTPTPPPPAPTDAGAAQKSFWQLMAYILGRGIPRVLQDILDQIRNLRNV
jgi:hypothetical protein